MNIKSLKVFLLILENGTLARASQILNLSPPAVSRLLGLLEQELGYSLFERTKKRLVPTQAAEKLYPEVLRILSGIEELPDLMRQIESGDQLPLKVICNPRIIDSIIVPAVGEFIRKRPDARIFVDVLARRNFGRSMTIGQFHLGILSLPAPGGETLSEPLCETPLGVLVSINNPLSACTCIDFGDLVDEPYVALPKTALVRQLIDNELFQRNLNFEPRQEFSTSYAAHQLVEQGYGFTITDRLSLGLKIPKNLRLIPLKSKILLRLGIFTSGTTEHPLAKPFSDHLRSIISNTLKV